MGRRRSLTDAQQAQILGWFQGGASLNQAAERAAAAGWEVGRTTLVELRQRGQRLHREQEQLAQAPAEPAEGGAPMEVLQQLLDRAAHVARTALDDARTRLDGVKGVSDLVRKIRELDRAGGAGLAEVRRYDAADPPQRPTPGAADTDQATGRCEHLVLLREMQQIAQELALHAPEARVQVSAGARVALLLEQIREIEREPGAAARAPVYWFPQPVPLESLAPGT